MRQRLLRQLVASARKSLQNIMDIDGHEGFRASQDDLTEVTMATGGLRSEDGFSLVEVVVAMVVLAVGLLALESVGLAAARSIALADRQSGHAILASDSLEAALYQLRSGVIPVQFCRRDLPFGDHLSRLVDLTDPLLGRVTVRAIPDPAANDPRLRELEISSSLYLPTGLSGPPAGAPC
ncbi:MAG: prepilin-type N-terminal cleavage/methylation domain-containing protein [Gemmatimonas sp.]|nr:prepilin-type N-terminal cleavage/methylation domain-containing protein [Gemmatimonas sp.]